MSGDENNDDQKVQNENRISPFENETENKILNRINPSGKITENKDTNELICLKNRSKNGLRESNKKKTE